MGNAYLCARIHSITMLKLKKTIVFMTLLLTGACVLPAQTVIDLRRGGATVRHKNKSDYDRPLRSPQQLRQDSLDYIDCLTRGFNHLYADSLKGARTCFEQALKLRPEAPGNFIVRRQLGGISMAEGHYEEAVSLFSEVLAQKPEDYDARLQRASCHIELQHPQQALEDCRTLFLQTFDTIAAVRVLFVQAAAHKQLRQYVQVEEDLQHIIHLDPANASAQLLLAVNLEQMGQAVESLNRLNMYLSAHPDDVAALSARAQYLLRHDRALLALEDVNHAVALSPTDATLYVLRSSIHEAMGHKDEAEKDRRRAAAL